MAYNPTVWETGDIVTADLLNKMETGIENASVTSLKITLTFDGENIYADKTYNQIVIALNAGRRVFAIPEQPLDAEVSDDTHYYVVMDADEYGYSPDMHTLGNWQGDYMVSLRNGYFVLYADSPDVNMEYTVS